jgi:hypothetical protein
VRERKLLYGSKMLPLTSMAAGMWSKQRQRRCEPRRAFHARVDIADAARLYCKRDIEVQDRSRNGSCKSGDADVEGGKGEWVWQAKGRNSS